MPVTPTLLLKLRKTLGDEATTDLVTWVDGATAREMQLIREMAELHYSRFDARLEQRVAELKAELIKWMFLFWVGTIVPLAGLIVALVKL
jgi:hypothetical protein